MGQDRAHPTLRTTAVRGLDQAQLDELREENARLLQRATDAEQALHALGRGEVEAGTLEASVAPDLLDAAQDKLQRSERILRAVFDGALDAMLLADEAGRFVDANAAACELFGLPRERVIGRTTAEVSSAESDETERMTPAHGRVRGQIPLRRLDGSWRMLEYSAASDVAPGLHLWVLRDVTERVAAEAALRRSEALFRAVIEKSNEGISLTAADGTTRYLTPSAGKILGWTREEMATKTLRDQVVPEDQVRIASALDRLVKSGERDMFLEIRVQHRDGTILWIETSATNLLDDPDVRAIVGNYRDITARKRSAEVAAKALQEVDLERRTLVAVLAALPVGVWIADAGGRLTQTNPAAGRIWGGQAPHAESPEEYGVYRASWPASGKPLAAEDWALARTFKTGETIIAEAVDIERFDGTRGHVLNSTAPILDEQGRIAGGVVVLLDVSEKRAADREREQLITTLEFERGRLGTLLAKAPAFIAVFRGKDHVFELVNEAYCKLTGRGDLVGRPLIEALPELAGQGFVELLDKVLETGEPFSAKGRPVTLVRQRGDAPEQRYVDFMYQPLVEADGTRTGVFAHGIDVTDATIAQQRLRAQFHGVPVPTYVWQRIERDREKHFVLVDYNQAALTISEGGIAKHVGESAITYFSDAPGVLDELDRCLDEGVTIQREMDRTSKSTGKTRRLFVTYASAPPDLVVVHTEDITERVALEQQYRQAQKMEAIGRLAGGVAHDFNNLLSVILSYAALALASLKPGDPLAADIQEIEGAGRRAATLTRQLLAFSRQQVLQPRVVDLGRIIDGMTSMLGRLLGEDVALTVRTERVVGHVLTDPGQIEQVVMNLAVNARDAMPEGGKITIELSDVELDAGYVGEHLGVVAGSYVLLSIGDTGMGMDAATRARIFEPFFTTKETGKGTGLGLSTVFGIVEQSQGHVAVESEPGRGSTFKVYLPRTSRDVDASVSPLPRADLRGSETILLVEDEEHVRAVACAILRRNGYHVLETSNAGEALLVARDFAGKIHLLLTDVVMPRLSGRKLAEELALQRPEMQVLFVSGYTDDAIVHHGVRGAGVAFLQKPFTPDALARKVRVVLDAPRSSAGGVVLEASK